MSTETPDYWTQIRMDRTPVGLKITVQADPKVEAFMASLGDGKTHTLATYGRGWQPPTIEAQLEVYDVHGGGAIPDKEYTISAVGSGLVVNDLANLSFLRFKGLGSPEGVTFVIPGPFSRAYLKPTSDQLLTAIKHFLKDYVVPTSVLLKVTSQGL
jgi:hypothetical protein